MADGLFEGFRSRLKLATKAFWGALSDSTYQDDALNKQHILSSLYGYSSIFDGVQNVKGAAEYDNIVTRYTDYEAMDDYDITSSMYDLYADDTVQMNPETGEVLRVKCDNSVIKEHLDFLYNNNLKVKDEAWSQARNLCKYGNDISSLVIKEGYGVIAERNMPPPTVRRIEDLNGHLLGFVKDVNKSFSSFSVDDFYNLATGKTTSNEINKRLQSSSSSIYEDFEVVHRRIRGKNRGSKYGYSVLEPTREAFKKLLLLENNQIYAKVQKGSDKRAFFVEVGDMPKDEVKSYIHDFRRQFKKKRFLQKDGTLDLSLNPNSEDDDYYFPIRQGNDKSRVEVIQGQDVDLTNTLSYFLSKVYTSGKVPKSFLGDEDGKRVSLASQDIRFARTILRVQNSMLHGYEKSGNIHLATLGINPDKVDYSLHLVTPSAIFDEIRYEIMSTQLGIAQEYKAYTSKRWVMKNFLGFSDTEIDQFIAERKKEQDAGWLDESMSHYWKKGINGGVRDHEKIIEDNFNALLESNHELKDKKRILTECVDLLRMNTKGFQGIKLH